MNQYFLSGRAWWAVALLALAGCRGAQEPDTSRPHGAQFGFQTTMRESQVEEGRLTYERYCIGCHGETGDGNGEAARFLSPRPRNFINARFKFSSTRSGQLPTDDDLRRSIRYGLKGSAMPPFDLLPDRTVDSLIAYIKTFSPLWREREPAAPIPIIEDPFSESEARAEAIRRGELVYHGFATCWSCHPAYVPEQRINEMLVSLGGVARPGFRPHLQDAEGKPNDEGELIYPPDFRRDFVKGGMTVQDLYRSISAGITGTAMPTWVDTIHALGKTGDQQIVSQGDLWAMAYYVQDLMARRPALLTPGEFVVRQRPRPIYPPGVTPPPATVPGAAPSTQPADVDFDF